MDLVAEYWERHKISSPLIRFPNNGYLLCRYKHRGDSTGEARFVVFLINFYKKTDTPPYLTISCNSLIHDNPSGGGSNGQQFTKLLWNKRIEFEEWETFITEWANSLKGNLVIVKPEEIPLALWEMFVYTHDHWLSQCLPPNLYDPLTKIIDESCKLEDRLESSKVIESWLNGRAGRGSQSGLTSLNKAYDLQGYATWLASMLTTV